MDATAGVAVSEGCEEERGAGGGFEDLPWPSAGGSSVIYALRDDHEDVTNRCIPQVYEDIA